MIRWIVSILIVLVLFSSYFAFTDMKATGDWADVVFIASAVALLIALVRFFAMQLANTVNALLWRDTHQHGQRDQQRDTD